LVLVIDFIAFLLSLIMMASVFIRYKKLDTVFLLFLLSITMNCIGRYMTTVSQNLETAILSNKIMYVSACYAPVMLVWVLFKLSNMRFPKILATIMTVYSSVVLFFVFTNDYTKLYYKEVKLVSANGYNYLSTVYGPLHALYLGVMVFYVVFILFFLVGIFLKRRKISQKTVLGMSLVGLEVIVLYVVEKVFDLKTSVISIGYLVAMVYIIRYFDRINMYDMSANIINSIEERGEYGYIVFDNKMRYVSANGYIKEIFPEINQWKVDHSVTPSESKLYNEIVEYFLQMEWKNNSQNKVVEADDRFYEVSIRTLSHGRKKTGYLIELMDRTVEQSYYKKIENYNEALQQEVEEQTKNILHIKDMMVLGMADMVESRDNNTGGHIKRTSAIVDVFSKRLADYCDELEIDGSFLKLVAKAAPMHDLGKIAIDDDILRKPGKFTEEEYNEMKRHTTEGARIVSSILEGVEDDEFVEIAKNVALYHHEKYNGKGYPTGVSGEQIPIEARIMALADVFDALVSERCYKKAFTFDQAFEIIRNDLGEHFDPHLGKIFIECRQDLEKI